MVDRQVDGGRFWEVQNCTESAELVACEKGTMSPFHTIIYMYWPYVSAVSFLHKGRVMQTMEVFFIVSLNELLDSRIIGDAMALIIVSHKGACDVCCILLCIMMTSSIGNIFRVTDPLCGEFTGHW